MSKLLSFANVPRQPHCSPEMWLVEAFDEELELWTLGASYGFVWALAAADAESPRCRALPRSAGITELREQYRTDPTSLVLGGHLMGETIDVEIANILVPFERDGEIEFGHHTATLSRVCERLRELQYYDGEDRLKRCDEARESEGGASTETLTGVLGIGLQS